MKTVVIVVLTVLLSALMFPFPVRAADSFDAMNRALGLLQSGEINAARSVLSGIATDNAPDGLISATQGVAEMYAGNYSGAETLFRKVLTQNPDQLTALWGLSLCLLQQSRAFEAAGYIDRAAVVAPDNVHIKAVQAYVYMLLDRLTDAATVGKAALDGGETSPFLMATLAQVYRRMGYAYKALEFGSFAAKSFYGMDFLAQDRQVSLPLTMIIADTPQALSQQIGEAETPTHLQRTNLEDDPPQMTAPQGEQKAFRIISPQADSTVQGVQRIQVAFSGTHKIKFVAFQVDHVLRGMTTELPFSFDWDADAAAPGEHNLSARAYDDRGILVAEDAITVRTTAGAPSSAPEVSADALALQKRIIAMTMPDPMPLSLFTQLGWWHRDVHETSQAIAAFEKAAAIDPTADGVLTELAQLYKEHGLHDISSDSVIYHGPDTGRKLIALTFDDGPNPLYTPTILSYLRQYNAHATFFMVGKMVQKYPDLALQILADGHELANHSYTHPNLTHLKQSEILAEVLRGRATIKEITGQQTYLFRPPGGDIDPFVASQLHSLDYNIVYWSVNAGDFKKLPPEEQAAQIVKKSHDGSIILLHDGLIDGTLNFLPTLLADYSKLGYTFVTVSELLAEKPAASTSSTTAVIH